MSMASFREDFLWQMDIISQVRALLGQQVWKISDDTKDQKEACDLILQAKDGTSVAVRLRRDGYKEKYRDEFTIRCQRSNGTKTELAKILEGYADWMFYGHTESGKIVSWMLIDLDAFRFIVRFKSYLLTHPDEERSGRKDNRDGRTSFLWFNAVELSRHHSRLIIARGRPRCGP